MNQEQQQMYADFIMGMRQRGKEEQSANSEHIPENAAAEKLYGSKYGAIRADFTQRVHDRINSSENRSVEDRLP